MEIIENDKSTKKNFCQTELGESENISTKKILLK